MSGNQMPDSIITSVPTASGVSLVVFGVTLSDWVLIGWIIYIAVAVIPKLPAAWKTVSSWIDRLRK